MSKWPNLDKCYYCGEYNPCEITYDTDHHYKVVKICKVCFNTLDKCFFCGEFIELGESKGIQNGKTYHFECQ